MMQQEVHNITYGIFLSEKMEPECNQASRSNHQLTGSRGDRGINEIMPQEAISHPQNAECLAGQMTQCLQQIQGTKRGGVSGGGGGGTVRW